MRVPQSEMGSAPLQASRGDGAIAGSSACPTSMRTNNASEWAEFGASVSLAQSSFTVCLLSSRWSLSNAIVTRSSVGVPTTELLESQ